MRSSDRLSCFLVVTLSWAARYFFIVCALDMVDKKGTVTLRYRGLAAPHRHLCRLSGWRVAMLVNDRDIEIEIVSLDCSPLRRLVLDPARGYQPQP
jgi:hypothetical protein